MNGGKQTAPNAEEWVRRGWVELAAQVAVRVALALAMAVAVLALDAAVPESVQVTGPMLAAPALYQGGQTP